MTLYRGVNVAPCVQASTSVTEWPNVTCMGRVAGVGVLGGVGGCLTFTAQSAEEM